MNPEESGSEIDTPAANDNSDIAANVDIVLDPAVNNNSGENSGKEEHLKNIEEVVEELVDPKEIKTDDSESNTRVKKGKNC